MTFLNCTGLNTLLQAAVPPAAPLVLRITLDIRNIMETVILYLVQPTWRRQECQPQVW